MILHVILALINPFWDIAVQNSRQALFQIILDCHISNFFLPDFVEPISYQIILEIQLILISARRAKDCCRSALLVAFKIPDHHLLSCLSN